MDLQWINGTDSVAEMATKSNVNFNALTEGVGADITEANTYTDTVSATAKSEAITETQTWAMGVFSNNNIFRNSDFLNSVNQRGFTSITSSAVNKYTIDGWYFYANSASNTCELTSGGIKFTNVTATGCRYGQFYDVNDINKYAGKTVTLTLEYSSDIDVNLYATTGGIHTLIKTFLSSSTKDTVTFTFPSGSSNVGIFIQTASILGGIATVSRIKLELGSIATPFVPRDDLFECYKYRIPLYQYTRLRAGEITSGYIDFSIVLPRAMRTTSPTLIAPNIAVKTTVGVVQTGFTFNLFTDGISPYAIIRASKASHGLTDAILSIGSGGANLDAEL